MATVSLKIKKSIQIQDTDNGFIQEVCLLDNNHLIFKTADFLRNMGVGDTVSSLLHNNSKWSDIKSRIKTIGGKDYMSISDAIKFTNKYKPSKQYQPIYEIWKAWMNTTVLRADVFMKKPTKKNSPKPPSEQSILDEIIKLKAERKSLEMAIGNLESSIFLGKDKLRLVEGKIVSLLRDLNK
jgi:hypothetical protein